MFTVNPDDFSLGVVDMAIDKSGQDQAIIVSSNIDTARKAFEKSACGAKLGNDAISHDDQRIRLVNVTVLDRIVKRVPGVAERRAANGGQM